MRLALRDERAVGVVAQRVGRVAVDGQLGLARGHEHLLPVRAALQEDALGAGGGRRQRVDRLLDAGARLDRDAARGRAGPGCAQGSRREGQDG